MPIRMAAILLREANRTSAWSSTSAHITRTATKPEAHTSPSRGTAAVIVVVVVAIVACTMAAICSGVATARSQCVSRRVFDRAPLPWKMKIAIFHLEPNITHVQDQKSHSAKLKLQGQVPNLVSGSSCGTARTVTSCTCPSAQQCTSRPSC